ncbi:hypothetical protein GGR53DRAFT_364309 [Hypoxylon sp. FL1150]|nr:hypothetical protein GGR53DRAFT_364309 [Hypoxylon sp. FL1150]
MRHVSCMLMYESYQVTQLSNLAGDTGALLDSYLLTVSHLPFDLIRPTRLLVIHVLTGSVSDERRSEVKTEVSARPPLDDAYVARMHPSFMPPDPLVSPPCYLAALIILWPPNLTRLLGFLRVQQRGRSVSPPYLPLRGGQRIEPPRDFLLRTGSQARFMPSGEEFGLTLVITVIIVLPAKVPRMYSFSRLSYFTVLLRI